MTATNFFENPILNSPYERPEQHWELDAVTGHPTGQAIGKRRLSESITPIPKSRKQRQKTAQASLDLEYSGEYSDDRQKYKVNETIMAAVCNLVDRWRMEPNPSKWNVTPVTERLN